MDTSILQINTWDGHPESSFQTRSSGPQEQRVSSENAVEFIRERILNGIYPAGSFLSSKALAQELSISRTPVRDALRILETQGLVEITPRLGARIPQLSSDEVSDLLGLRCVLEAYCAYLAAQRRSVHDLARMEQHQLEMETILEAGAGSDDSQAFHRRLAREDYLFHWQIVHATRNRFVIEDIERSRALLTVFSPTRGVAEKRSRNLLETAKIVCAMHRDILEAIRRQDAPAAKQAMERHLSVP